LTGDDVQVVDGGNPAQVEQVLSGAAVAGAVSWPMADKGECVLDLDALPQLRTPFGGLLGLARLREQCLVGCTDTLCPFLLAVQRSCSGYMPRTGVPGKADGLAGPERHDHPGGAGQPPGGEVNAGWRLANQPEALGARHALQKMTRSCSRSRTRSEAR
jgi:hypothetical protein